MSDRPTPETDQFKVKLKTTCGEKYWVPVEHSERLERERDEAREAADKWRKLHDAKDELFKKGIAEVERERDELIEHLESEKITRNAVIDKLGKAIKERDEAREALRVILRIVESFRYSTALGKSQLERFETAKRLLESAK